MNCQTPSGGCTAVPAFKLTFQSAPSKGCHGMTWIEATCRSHATTRTDQVRAEGGSCIAADPLPDPPPNNRAVAGGPGQHLSGGEGAVVYRTVVRPDGSLSLGPDALRQGYRPGAVVEVILTRAGSLIVALDDSPPPMVDVAFKPLTGGQAQLAARTGRRAG